MLSDLIKFGIPVINQLRLSQLIMEIFYFGMIFQTQNIHGRDCNLATPLITLAVKINKYSSFF
jgi:hypothetical protein